MIDTCWGPKIVHAYEHGDRHGNDIEPTHDRLPPIDLVKRYGDDAMIEASARADELLEPGDHLLNSTMAIAT